jgi:Zn-dependent M28 family amino/carboxypeptidase
LEESTLGDILLDVARAYGIGVGRDQEPERSLFTRSDQYSLVREGVPALAFKFGFEPGSEQEKIARAWLRERYHAPSDDVNQPVDIEAAGQFNELLAKLTAAVANRDTRPEWKADSFFRRFARQEMTE